MSGEGGEWGKYGGRRDWVGSIESIMINHLSSLEITLYVSNRLAKIKNGLAN
jgi:hypothetical protein